MSIRAVVFDLFDTLVDLLSESIPYGEFRGRRIPRIVLDLHSVLSQRVADLDFDAFTRAMKEVDREFRQSHYAQGLELPTRERFRALLARLQIDDPELSEVLTRTHMEAVSDQVRVIDHHPDVLANLRERSSIGLCSNFSHAPTAVEILEESDLKPHFDAIVISEEVGVRKPRPEIFEAVLRALAVAPEETLHVGDSLSADVEGAAALGIRTAWITRRISDPPRVLGEYEGPRPDWQIADLSELPLLLRRAQASE